MKHPNGIVAKLSSMYPFVELPNGSNDNSQYFLGGIFMFSLFVNLVFKFFCHLHIDVEMRKKKKGLR
jgi:quinol-cytochrome oxidoreductase complex cytochrome b subunit